jgi:hypothetical protein
VLEILVVDPNDQVGTCRQLVEMISRLETRVMFLEEQVAIHAERDATMDAVLWAHFDALAEDVAEIEEAPPVEEESPEVDESEVEEV